MCGSEMEEWTETSDNNNADTKNLQCQGIFISDIFGEVFVPENSLRSFFIVRIDNVEDNPDEDGRSKTESTCDNTTD